MASSTSVLEILVQLKDEASAQMQKMAGVFGGSWNKAVEGSQAFATTLGIAGAAAGGYIVAATLTAARTETLGVAMNAIAKATGTSTQILNAQEAALKKQGITTQEARGILTLFMQSQLDVADASKISRVAQDLAVISGQNSSEAARTLTEAIAGQEPMLLRQYGIVKMLPDIYKQYGEQLGIASEKTDKNGKVSETWTRDLTDVEKKQAMVNLILKEGEKVTGAYESAMGTAGKKMTSLTRYFEEAANSVGTVFLPVFGQLIDGLTEFLKQITSENINKWIGKLKEMQTPIIIVAGAIVGALVPAIWAAVVAFGALMISLAPFIIGGAIIGGIVAGIVWIVQNWKMIQAKAIEIWGAITAYLSGVWAGITAAAQNIWGGITAFFQGIWNGIKTVFTLGAELAVGAVITYFNFFGIDIIATMKTIIVALRQAWTTIQVAFSAALTIVQGVWKTVWTAISGFLTPIWEGIKKTVGDAWTWMTVQFNTLSKPISDAWTAMWNGLGSIVTAVWTGIVDSFKAGINFIIKGINTVISGLNSVASKGGSALGMKAISIPSIPMLAQGGIVTGPTLALIGENGPEAVVPLNGAVRGGVGGNVYITIENVNGTDKEAARKLCAEIMRGLKLNYSI